MASFPSSLGQVALAAGLIGAVTRPAAVYAFILAGLRTRPGEEWNIPAILGTSALIGLGIGSSAGLIANAIRRPLLGSLIGAVYGAILAVVSIFFTAVFLCVATWNMERTDIHGMTYGPELFCSVLALTGAFPGIAGGLLGARMRNKRAATDAKSDPAQ